MSKSKGTVRWESLQEGDIISYNTQGPATTRRNKPTSHALVFDRVELVQQKGSPLSHFVIYPVVELEEATASLRHKSPLNAETAQDLGLPFGKEWVILIDPVKIDPEDLSDRDSAAKHLGNFKEHQSYDQFLDTVGRHESRGRQIEEGPRTRHTMNDVWGLFPPVGITRENSDDDFEAVPTQQPKTKSKKNNNAASTVRGVDISLRDAVKADLLDEKTAKLFEEPKNKRLKKFTRLANVFDLARQDPSALEKYVSQDLEIQEDVNLSDLEGMGFTIHPTVVRGLAEPRDGKKGEGAKPITTLKDAYHLVANDPDLMKKYNYLGEKMQEHARNQIPAAYQKIAEEQGAKTTAAKELSLSIKSAYGKLSNDYIEIEKTQVIPDRYIGESGNVMWTFGPRRPE